MNTTSLIVVGTPFAGTALLGHALGAHPEAFFAGESWRHWDRAAAAAERACAECGPGCATWGSPAVQAAVAQGPAALNAALAAAAGRRVVVEGPVTAGWLAVRLADGAAVSEDTRIVLCACDPVLYARKRSGVTAELATLRAAEWRDEQAAAIRAALASGRPVLTVRYEDLVARPAETLARVCAFAGLAADPTLEAWETVPSHAIGARTEAWGVATPVHAASPRPAALDRKGARVDTWAEFDTDPAACLELEAVRATLGVIRPSGLYETFGYEPKLPPRHTPLGDADRQVTREWVVEDLGAIRDAVLGDRAAEAIGTLRMLVDHFGTDFDTLRLEATYETLAIVLVDLLNNQLRTADALPYARALLEYNPHNPETRRLLDVALAGCGQAGGAGTTKAAVPQNEGAGTASAMTAKA